MTIASRKKYVPVKDLKVYPSNKETIEVIPDDCNGAHRYRAQMCAGFDKGPLQFEIDEQLNTTWYKE